MWTNEKLKPAQEQPLWEIQPWDKKNIFIGLIKYWSCQKSVSIVLQQAQCDYLQVSRLTTDMQQDWPLSPGIIASSPHQDLFCCNSFIMADCVMDLSSLIHRCDLLFHIPQVCQIPAAASVSPFIQLKSIFYFMTGQSATDDTRLMV